MSGALLPMSADHIPCLEDLVAIAAGNARGLVMPRLQMAAAILVLKFQMSLNGIIIESIQ